MTENTTQQVHKNKINPPNPDGKGGFGDNPQNRNPGGWKKENTFSYQMNRFKNMTVDELRDWNKNTPNSERTVAEDLAFARVFKAQKELSEFKEVADRTEGKAVQKIEHDGGIDTGMTVLANTIQELIKLDEPDNNQGNKDISK
jgi:hypothetical protein